MQYYVIGPDGNKYGPADVATLKGWVAENRLSPDSMLEDFNTGQRVPASQVPGLFEQAVATGAPAPAPSMYENPPQPAQAGYQRPGMYGDDGSKELTNSFIYLALSFFCCFAIFSPLGIIQANKAMAKGNPSANIARILHFVWLGIAIVGTIGYAILVGLAVANGGVPR